MYVAPHNDFTFIHLNKTGGRSIIKFLSANLQNVYCLGAPFIHKPLYEVLPNVMGSRILTCIRNPFDRYESLYSYRLMKYSQGSTGGENAIAKGLRFEHWMDYVFGSDLHTNMTQSDLLDPWPDELHVVRLEHLKADLSAFLGISCSTLPHANKSIREPVKWPEMLRRDIREVEAAIFEYYEEDEL